MNVSDTEIVYAVLKENNYIQASTSEDADIVLLMTCAIREGAESKIWHRLAQLNSLKQDRKKIQKDLTVGVLGI